MRNAKNYRFLLNPDRVAAGLGDMKSSMTTYTMIYPLSRPVPRKLPCFEAEERINVLAASMPHFEVFFDIVRKHISLVLDYGSAVFTLPNLLLVGSPGIGKTYVMNETAKALGLDFAAIPMSLNNTRFALTGLERGWTGFRPGELARVASQFTCFNALLMLDEFEKAQWETAGNMQSVTTAVLQLFERDTAAKFRDVAIEGDLDLSELSILATANDVSPIPDPVMSRLTTLHIPDPPVKALQNMTANILTKAAREDMGLHNITVVAEPCVADVFDGGVSPRTLRNQSVSVLYPLLAPKSDVIRVTGRDLRKGLAKEDKQSKTTREIGFHAVH